MKFLYSYPDVEPYIKQAQAGADSERNSLGFLPPNAYQQAAQQRKLFVAVNEARKYLGHLGWVNFKRQRWVSFKCSLTEYYLDVR